MFGETFSHKDKSKDCGVPQIKQGICDDLDALRFQYNALDNEMSRNLEKELKNIN